MGAFGLAPSLIYGDLCIYGADELAALVEILSWGRDWSALWNQVDD